MQNRLKTVKLVSNILAILVMLIAGLVMIGWWFNIPVLKTVLPGLASMKFNTALLFLLSGLSIIRAEQHKLAIRILSICIILFSLATLSQWIFDVNLRIDRLFALDSESSGFPGRMSIATAINFAILGIGLFLKNNRPGFVNIFAIVVALFSSITLIAYLYNAEILYTASLFSAMALHTALFFFVLSISLVLSNTNSRFMTIFLDDTAGAILLRILLPVMLVILLLMEWTFNLGHQLNLYSFEFNTVLISVSSIVVLVTTIYFLALRLHRIDKQRLEAIEQLSLNKEALEVRVKERTEQLEIANENLRKSNERFEAAEILGKFGHWERDLDSNTAIWSRGAYQIFGVSGNKAPNLEEFLSYVHEDDREIVHKVTREAREGQTSFTVEYRIIRPDGEERSIYSTWQYDEPPGTEAARDTVQLQGIMIDVTHLKQLEKANVMYQMAVEASSELIVVVNREHRYEIANRVYRDYNQVSREQVIGHHLEDILGEELYQSRVGPAMERCFAGEAHSLENTVTYPVLGLRHMLATYSPIYDSSGTVTHVVGIIRDITESKLASTRLEQVLNNISKLNQDMATSKTRFEGILNTAHDAIVSIDEDEKIVVFNQGAERIFGYNHDEIIGQELSILIPDAIKKHHHHHIEAFKTSDNNNRRMAEDRPELLALHKNGKTFPIQVSLSHSRIQQTQLFTAVIRDISQQKQMEKTIRLANTALEHSNKELQQFAYIISHDMRAPLINLKGFSNMLEKAVNNILDVVKHYESEMQDNDIKRMQSLANDRIPTALNFIASSVTRLDQYTEAILALSRAGRRELKPESVNLDMLITAIIDSLHVSIEEKNISIHLSDIQETFLTDRFAIDQILMNVITNAVKYMEREEGGLIEISSEVSGEDIIFIVKDNGRGISKSDFDRVFAPFRRAGKNNVEGEGMGLAYVQTLVKRLNGDIWFSSTVDEGTSFYIRLPALEL